MNLPTKKQVVKKIVAVDVPLMDQVNAQLKKQGLTFREVVQWGLSNFVLLSEKRNRGEPDELGKKYVQKLDQVKPKKRSKL